MNPIELHLCLTRPLMYLQSCYFTVWFIAVKMYAIQEGMGEVKRDPAAKVYLLNLMDSVEKVGSLVATILIYIMIYWYLVRWRWY